MKARLGKLSLDVVEDNPLAKSFEITNNSLRLSDLVVNKSGSVMKTPDSHISDSKEDSIQIKLPRQIDSCKLFVIGDLGVGQNGTVQKGFYLPELDVLALKPVDITDRNLRHQISKELASFSKAKVNVIKWMGAYFNREKEELVMALEYMNRGSLASVVKHHGPIPEPALKWIVKQTLEGLHGLHSAKQIHRDIKPDNILVNHKGEAKLGDFGLLKQLDTSTQLGSTFMGTTNYLSPERVRASPYSYPSDIWSVGLSIIHCAEGQLPDAFLSHDFWTLLRQIAEKDPPKLNPRKFSPEFCDLVAQCLIKDPEKRATAEQLLNHPALRDASNADWPYKDSNESELDSVGKINAILIEHMYKDGKFEHSLYDKARFKRIADQLGVSYGAVARNFRDQFLVKFPDAKFN